MANSLRNAVEDCALNRRPEEVCAFRLGGQVTLAQRLGRRVAIVRNADVKAILLQRDALLDAAHDAQAALMLAKKAGNYGFDDLLSKLTSAIGAVERTS